MSFIEKMKCEDIFEFYRIDSVDDISDPSKWHKQLETCNNPTRLQKILRFLGLHNYAGDALTNYAINDLAIYTASKYLYAGVGTDGTNGTVYSYTNLRTPVMSRIAITPALVNTYSSDALLPDTVQYTIVSTATGDYTLMEAGLFDALTGGNMGSRQTFAALAVTNGELYAMVWKIIYGRG